MRGTAMSDKLERVGFRLRWVVLAWIVGMWANFLYLVAGGKGAAFVEKALSWIR